MAYLSSTTTSPNVPVLVWSGLTVSQSSDAGSTKTGFTGRKWAYNSTHISSDLSDVSGFFTDAQKLGFRTGDMLEHYENISTGVVTSHRVEVVSSTGATVSIGTTIGLGT